MLFESNRGRANRIDLADSGACDMSLVINKFGPIY